MRLEAAAPHLAWICASLLCLWAQAHHVLLYLRTKPILQQSFGDRITGDLARN